MFDFISVSTAKAPIRLALVAGARPNFMKIAPLMKALAGNPDFDALLIHTGQHYDDNMSGQFFRDLGIPAPHYRRNWPRRLLTIDRVAEATSPV